jgi:hypothetical protein
MNLASAAEMSFLTISDGRVAMKLDVPVAFFLFNRPQETARVFAEIAKAKPARLFLIADGPRHSEERDACEAARQIVKAIDWTCEVRRNFSDVNLGCRRRMSSGIDWVFSLAERAILLEDDCVPDPTFFPFCTELLDRYEADPRVMMISGDNMQMGRRCTPNSYYFSAIPHIWGWATWRRAWKHYDVEMRDWPTVRGTDFPGEFVVPSAARVHRKMMEDVHAGRLDTWDVQWEFACWRQRGLSILPAVNLITNIGYGSQATHTRKRDAFADLRTEAMECPLRHPATVELHREADRAFFDLALKAA